MLTTILSILAALLVFGFIVVIHEGGHFLMARAMKIPVEEFAVGFGPKLFSFRGGDVLYTIRCLPLGGFVRFYGEDETGDARALALFSPWKRIAVSLAGVVANVVVAVLVAVVILMTYGENVVANVVAEVDPNSPAYVSGVQADDRIVQINGIEVTDGNGVSGQVAANGLDTMALVVERGGERVELALTPFYDEELGRARIGITMGYVNHRFALGEALPISLNYVRFVVVETFGLLRSIIFKGQGTDQVMGIVGAVGVMSEGVRQSFETVLRMAVLISINLAIFNILPLPALDGGKIVFYIIELIRGKPVPPEKEGLVHLIGFGLLIVLALLLVYQDIARLISGG